jgi:hypothetical protein
MGLKELVEKNSLTKTTFGEGPISRFLDLLSFTAVSVYLGLVLAFLLLSGRLKPGLSFRSTMAALTTRLRQRRLMGRRPLKSIRREEGHCFTAPLPFGLTSDQEGQSRLRVYEDGEPLGPAHSLHDTVRQQGQGAFSHWGATLYFSTSDNGDPTTNGRTYEIAEDA